MDGSVGERFALSRANPANSLARTSDAGQPLHSSTAPGGRYAFVRQAGVSLATLAIADADARRIGVATHEVLLSAGYLSHTAYAAALARWLDAPVAGWDAVLDIEAPVDFDDPDERPLRGHMDGRPYIFLCAEAGTPEELAARVTTLRGQGLHVALSSRVHLEAAIEPALRASRLKAAVQGLHSRDPAFSAAGLIWLRQVIAAVVMVGLIVGGLWVAPEMTIAAVSAIIALPFLCVTLLRVAALREIVSGRAPRVGKRALHPQPLAPRTLPVYTILVPLFREAKVLPGLAQALQNLVYPKAKLEILLVLEAADLETQAAVLRLRLPGNFRVVVVPEQAPQTKPKALNYALQYARGDYIVVYDAEDRPEPDQLLRALAAFERLPADVGCLQAQLNIHNPYRSWLTRQFTVEYSALFDAILPALARLRLPVPLGGTSNHFRRDVLVGCGGWDPYNVTEDADLGLRLARRGWRTAMLASTTWEEAPVTLRQWFPQRCRWLKGWMQTYLVHTREPRRLNAELGLRAALGLHALMGALLLSALAHPVFYLLLGYHAWQGGLAAPSASGVDALFWSIAFINLGAGYVTAILIGICSVWRRQRRRLALSALFIPITWLLISAAAYRALWQLLRDPHLWEKTEHGDP